MFFRAVFNPLIHAAAAACIVVAAGLASPVLAQEAPAPMFPALVDRLPELSQLTVQNRRYSVVFELRDGVWVAADRGDYPIRQDVLAQTVSTLAGLREYEIRTTDPALYAQLDVTEPGPTSETVHIRAVAADGDVLADVMMGAPTAIMAPPPRTGTIMRRVDEAEVWLADGGFYVPNLLPDWFEPLLNVPGRDVERVIIRAGERTMFDAIKIDFTTGDYELAFLDEEIGGPDTFVDDNAVRALTQAILSTVFDNARRREELVIPDDARIVRYETRTGLSIDITVVSDNEQIWIVYDAVAEPGTEAVAQAADITTRTARWAFQLPESRILTLTREIALLVILPMPADDFGGPP